ncbi:MAG: hypothetical protein AAF891_06415 [Pseudomonadota bacterium]
MTVFRRLTTTTALISALALPLHAQTETAPAETPVTIWDTFSLDTLLTLLVQSFMPSLRVLADVRYSQIDVDAVRNRLALEGVDIRPFLPYAEADSCVVKADSLTLSGAPVDRQQGYALNLVLDGVIVDFDCLPPDVRPMVGMAGIENLRLDQAQIMANYDFATGGGDISLIADVDDLLSISASADLDYISYRMDLDSEEVMPAVYVNGVKLTLEDRGAYAIGKQMAPPDMLAPQAVAQMVQGGLMQMFSEMNGPASGAPSAEQSAFAAQAAEVLSAFVQDPGTLVLEAHAKGGPIRIGEGDFEDPNAIFSKLAPTIGTTPAAISTGISAAELKQAIDGLLPSERNLDVGRALLTGMGAPRNVTLGLRLLDPLAKDGNADATYLMAGAMADTQPDVAYRLALHAASNGVPGALSLMGDLEETLDLSQILDVQDAMLGGPVASDYESLGQIRRAARSHVRGTTRIRSYRAAYYWASVGAAAGDAASAAIRDEIDTLMRLRGSDAGWAEVRSSLENGVLRDWVGRDLPSALQ